MCILVSRLLKTSASPKKCVGVTESTGVRVLKSAILGAARSRCVAKLLQVGDTVEMNKSPRDHQDVEQLVGVELGKEDRKGRGK